MNFEFLFQSYNLFFTFMLVIAGLNMLNKIFGTIIKVFTSPDMREPVTTADESIDNKLDKEDLAKYASVRVNFKNVRKIPLIQYFINVNAVSPMFFINLFLFCFGIGGLVISYKILAKGNELSILNFLVCLAASAFIALVLTKIITYIFAKIFPTFNTVLYPRENLIGLPAWVLGRKQNLYICQVIEPCGQSFKVDVTLPKKETLPSYRAPVLLKTYSLKDDSFEGDFIDNEKATEIFNENEEIAFAAIRQELGK